MSKNEPKKVSHDWSGQVTEIAGRHAGITGVMASITITALVVVRHEAQPAALLFQALFSLLSASVIFSMVEERARIHRHFLFVLASVLFYFGVVSALAGVSDLLKVHRGMEAASKVMLYSATVGGLLAVFVAIHELLHRHPQPRYLAGFVVAMVALFGLAHFLGPREDGVPQWGLMLIPALLFASGIASFLLTPHTEEDVEKMGYRRWLQKKMDKCGYVVVAWIAALTTYTCLIAIL